jgi:hypothetical protein
MITPRLDEDVTGKVLMKNFVPASHLRAMFFQDRQNSSVEMRLQSWFIAKVLLLNERLDPGALFPVLVSDFIPADVQILVRKQR